MTKVMHCDDGNKLYDYSNEVVREYKDFSSRLELMFEKLAEYEDLEEEGLLLRLPCKVGDTVYSIANDGKIYPVKATREVRIVDGVLHIICESWRYSKLVSYDDIGKTVFFTQAEAEQKIKELIKEKKIKMYNLD